MIKADNRRIKLRNTFIISFHANRKVHRIATRHYFINIKYDNIPLYKENSSHLSLRFRQPLLPPKFTRVFASTPAHHRLPPLSFSYWQPFWRRAHSSTIQVRKWTAPHCRADRLLAIWTLAHSALSVLRLISSYSLFLLHWLTFPDKFHRFSSIVMDWWVRGCCCYGLLTILIMKLQQLDLLPRWLSFLQPHIIV